MLLLLGLVLVEAPGAWAAGECAKLPKHLFRPLVMPDFFDGRSPTRFWVKAHFSQPCQGLNLCYSRLGAQRELCDQEFGRELREVCERSYDGGIEGAARARCLLAVERLLRTLGENRGEAFRDAQYEAGWLEDRGRRKVPRPLRKWLTEEREPPPSRESIASGASPSPSSVPEGIR